MSNFVRRYLLDEVIKVEGVALQHCVTLRGIQKGDYGEVNERWPRLAEVESRLLGDRKPLERRWAEELVVDLNGGSGLRDRAVHQRRGCPRVAGRVYAI